MLSISPTLNRCSPNFTANPADNVTMKMARTTNPQGVGSDEESQGGHRRTAEAEGAHAPRPLPVSTARVAQGGGQHGEDDADDVLLLVELGNAEPDHQQDSANCHAGGQD